LTIQWCLCVAMVGGETRCRLSRDVRNTTLAAFPDHK
jgi:predicted transcriptional regulator